MTAPDPTPASPPGPLPAALLCDMDGTLVETEPYWFEAEHALVAEHGERWSEEDSRSLVGVALLDGARVLQQRGGVRLPARAVVEHLSAHVLARVRARVLWRPGALELLADARARGVPCALVTMSWAAVASAVVAALPEGTFAAVVTGDAVTRGKPHPEPYLVAAAALGAPPAHCLALEDSLTGLASALAAGVPTVGVENHVALPRPPHSPPGLTVLGSLAGLDLPALVAATRDGGPHRPHPAA